MNGIGLHWLVRLCLVKMPSFWKGICCHLNQTVYLHEYIQLLPRNQGEKCLLKYITSYAETVSLINYYFYLMIQSNIYCSLGDCFLPGVCVFVGVPYSPKTPKYKLKWQPITFFEKRAITFIQLWLLVLLVQYYY